MKNWMKELAYHYEKTRQLYPNKKLLILFDIDGTIIDMRHIILKTLKEYDFKSGTNFFSQMKINDIKVHENHVDRLLDQMKIPDEHQIKKLNRGRIFTGCCPNGLLGHLWRKHQQFLCLSH